MTSSSARSHQPFDGFFSASLADSDPLIFDAIQKELGRQQHEIELIASENIVSRAVLEIDGAVGRFGHGGMMRREGCDRHPRRNAN